MRIVSGLRNAFQNPLLIKELREEMRSRKIFFLVPVYIAILSTIALVSVGSSTSSSFNPLLLANNARYTLFAFSIAMTILIGLIGMILGAASFTTERERTTYELLELTPLSYNQLMLGKFLHAFVFLCLVLLSSLPVLSTLFFLGGLNYPDLILTFLYLLSFFSVVTLGSICISIVSSKTIFSVIFTLILGVVITVALTVISSGAFRNTGILGFASLSPWLVTWRQIFQPVPLKLVWFTIPIWLYYLLLYSLIGGLLLTWGSNALDQRKIGRNRRARLIALVLANVYVAAGISNIHAHHPISPADVKDIFEVILGILIVTLPFFTFGTWTEKDRTLFQKRTLRETFHLKNLFLNHPATAPAFLFILLITTSAVIRFCTGVKWTVVASPVAAIFIWTIPWLLLFLALRLFGLRSRGLLASYLLGFLFLVLLRVFLYTPGSSGLFEFLLDGWTVLLMYVITVPVYAAARIYIRRKEPATNSSVLG